MSSALGVSFLGAFQSSLSLLLTLGYGLFAARLGMVNDVTARDISSLCRNFFLPALLVTDIGGQLNIDNVFDYLPIVVWAVACAAISIIMGRMAVKVFGLPTWTVVAVTFNNATSLPLLLTKSLLDAGVLTPIIKGDAAAAVSRAGSYFLVNSLISKVLIFAIGPRLLGKDVWDNQPQAYEGDEETPGPEEDERVMLVPKPGRPPNRVDIFTSRSKVPASILAAILSVLTFFDPVSWGGIIAIIVGLVPALHHAAFAQGDQGGWLNPWLTSSLRNLGGLFSTLQLIVVGAKLARSFDVPYGSPSPQPPKRAVIVIVLIRFVVWSLISIPVIYLLASKTRILGDDPILWWTMMLMPVSPPALIMSVLLEVSDAGTMAKMMVARMLGYAYMATPAIAFAVVGALKATEIALDGRRHSS